MAILTRPVVIASLLGAVMISGLSSKDWLWQLLHDQSKVAGLDGFIGPAGPAEIPVTEQVSGAGVCGGFSQEGLYDNLPVAWSFRLCEGDEDQYEVQVRFRNSSDRMVSFQFRVWLERPESCDAGASGAALLIGGAKRLRPGENEEWPFSTGAVLRRHYRGKIWSCVIPEN